MAPTRSEWFRIPLRPEDFLDSKRVALVMWDMQKGLAGHAIGIDRIRTAAKTLISAADDVGIPVIWSRHILPPLHLIAGPFLLFLMKKQKVSHPSQLTPQMQRGMEDVEFVDGLQPSSNHIVLEKSQPSLFIDTPLDLRLKTLGRDTIVVAGVATDIGVEFTCRHAAALGYYSVVVEDATGSYSSKSHERSLEFLRNWTTLVLDSQSICKHWRSAN